MLIRFLLLLSVVLVVVGLSYFYFSKHISPLSDYQPQETRAIQNSIPSEDVVTVSTGDDAFFPESVTVKKNTEVVFKNIASVPRWPASNIHPTHGIYPAFDPQRPIQPGESWSFVFDKVGTWKMHDHLVPRIRGTIIVTE